VDYFAVVVSTDAEGEEEEGGAGRAAASSSAALVGRAWDLTDPTLDYAAPRHSVEGGLRRGAAGRRGGGGGGGAAAAAAGEAAGSGEAAGVGGDPLARWEKEMEGVPHTFRMGEDLVEGHGDDSDEGETGEEGSSSTGAPGLRRLTPRRAYRRRTGLQRYRYPRADHADMPFPEAGALTYMLFPAGIAPIQSVQRPPTRRFMLVVNGEPCRHFCICLTAYRKEEVAASASSGSSGSTSLPSPSTSSSSSSSSSADASAPASASAAGGAPVESQWWPVVLYMLTRFPVAPQLQTVLERIWEVYDQGQLVQDLELGAVKEADSWCSLQEYLRMLVFEAPVPIRRVNQATQFFLPGPFPSPAPGGAVTVYLPPPDSLPAVPFHAPSALLAVFKPPQILAFLSALLLSRPVVIVGKSVQQLCQVQECALSLLYPLSKASMHSYLPIFPVSAGAVVLDAPAGICTGVLTAFACRLFSELLFCSVTGTYHSIVVVDATTGAVDTGCAPFMARRAAKKLRWQAAECARLGGAEAARSEAERRLKVVEKTLAVAENRLRQALGAKERGESVAEEDKQPILIPAAAAGSESDMDAWMPPGLLEYPWGGGEGDTVEVASTLALPEPIHSAAVQELTQLARQHAQRAADYDPRDGVSLQRANLALQAVCARIVATLLHGLRSHTFFSGEGVGKPPALDTEGWVAAKVEALRASVDKKAPASSSSSSSSSQGGSAEEKSATLSNRRHALALAALSPSSSKFLTLLCQSQGLTTLLCSHCSVYQRPYHVLTALLSANPTLEESKDWTPPVALPATTLVVPPPYGGDDLLPWQVAHAAPGAEVPMLPALDPPSTKRRGKQAYRVWPSQDVARAVDMGAREAAYLEALAHASVHSHLNGPLGPGGDDVGGETGGSERGMGEVEHSSMQLSAQQKRASSTTLHPAHGAKERAFIPSFSSMLAQLQPMFGRVGAGGGGALEDASLDDSVLHGDMTEEQQEEHMLERLHEWLRVAVWQQQRSRQPAARHHASAHAKSYAATFAASKGYKWMPEDEEVALMLSSPIPRAAFVRILQAQVMNSAGLQAPLTGARGVQLQLQPLLGMGVSDAILANGSFTASSHFVASSSISFKSLLVLTLPVESFGRLVTMMAALVEEAATDSDFPVAAALLQVATTFTCGRHHAHRVLSGHSLWKDGAFWESYVFEALAVEQQQARLLDSAAGEDASVGPAEASDYPSAMVVQVLTSLVAPMLSQDLPVSEARALVARVCAKCKVTEGESEVMKLLDAASGEVPATAVPRAAKVASQPTPAAEHPSAPLRPAPLAEKPSSQPVPAPLPAPQQAPPTPTEVAPRPLAAAPAVLPSTPSASVLAQASAQAASATAPAPLQAASTLTPTEVVSSEPLVAAPTPSASAVPVQAPSAPSVEPALSLPADEPLPSAAAASATAAAATSAAETAVPPAASVEDAPVPVPSEQGSAAAPLPLVAEAASTLFPDAVASTASGAPVEAVETLPAPSTLPVAEEKPLLPTQDLPAGPQAVEAQQVELVPAELAAPPPPPQQQPASAPPVDSSSPGAELPAPTSSPGAELPASTSSSASSAAPQPLASSSAVVEPPASTSSSASAPLPQPAELAEGGFPVPPPHPWSSLPEAEAVAAATRLLTHRQFPGTSKEMHALSAAGKRLAGGDAVVLAAANMEVCVYEAGDILESHGGAPGPPLPTGPLQSPQSKPRAIAALGKMFGVKSRLTEEPHPEAAAAGGGAAPAALPLAHDGTTRVTATDAASMGPVRAALVRMRGLRVEARKESQRTGEPAAPPSLAMANLTLRGHCPGAAISAMHFASDGRLVTGANDGRLSLWTMSGQRGLVHSYGEHGGMVTACKVAGDLVASGCEDGFVRLSAFPRAGSAAAPPHFAVAVRLRPAVLPSPVTALDVWERQDPAQLAAAAAAAAAASQVMGGDADPLRNHSAAAAAAAAAAPPAYPRDTHYVVAAGTADGRVVVYSADWRIAKTGVSSGKTLELSTHTNLHRTGSSVESVRVSSDGQLVVSAGRDGRLGIVNTPTGKTWVMSTPKAAAPPATRGFFSRGVSANPEPAPATNPALVPTGLPLYTAFADTSARPVLVYSAGLDGALRLWDLRTGSAVMAFASGTPIWAFTHVAGHGAGAAVRDASGAVSSPAALIGDRLLVTGHEDGLVRRWDSRMPYLPSAVWGGSPGAHRAILAMHAYDDLVATGSADGAVRMWDSRTGDTLLCRGHQGPVSGVAITRDFVVSTGWDGTVKAWAPETLAQHKE
jgi:WD40 repeat protein